MTKRIGDGAELRGEMKYLRCRCCNFLAVIPKLDKEDGLLCPFCTRIKCNKGGFEIITREEFLKDIDDAGKAMKDS